MLRFCRSSSSASAGICASVTTALMRLSSPMGTTLCCENFTLSVSTIT